MQRPQPGSMAEVALTRTRVRPDLHRHRTGYPKFRPRYPSFFRKIHQSLKAKSLYHGSNDLASVVCILALHLLYPRRN